MRLGGARTNFTWGVLSYKLGPTNNDLAFASAWGSIERTLEKTTTQREALMRQSNEIWTVWENPSCRET